MRFVRKNNRGKGGGRRPYKKFMRRKVCRFCADKVFAIDYKNSNLLRNFITDRGKIMGGRMTGVCAHHQRMLNRALKRARDIALVPYAIV